MQDATPVAMTDKSKGLEPKGGSGDKCRFCLSREFKRSRLHANDLFTLLRMRVPARCVRCGQLQTISFRTAKRSLPAGSNSETASPLSPAMTPAALNDSGARSLSLAPELDSRAAIPHGVLKDALDIRCQYCPGQAFRRSRLRLQDVLLILQMRYSARCLRCGQRQTVNFMVAGSAVPSNVKQARILRNTETWREFTANSAPELVPMGRAVPLAPVIAQVYALKDAPLEDHVFMTLPGVPVAPVAPLAPAVEERPAAAAKPAAPAVKRPVDDQSIW